MTDFAFTGDLGLLSTAQTRALLDRAAKSTDDIAPAVSVIISDVRARGDEALRELALRLDGAALDALEVPRAEWERALASLDADVRSALEQAARNIAAFHSAQLPRPFEAETTPGVRLGRMAQPLRSVGVYAPGGRAAYPSSVLMGAVPARVAGVETVIVCSPPGPNGIPSDEVLAACAIAGADRVFAIGGAGAIAALAFGTQSVQRVDKIVGPGNAWVTEAKSQLNGVVATDAPAGPSEILIIADDTADATIAAAEMIAQAEHDPAAACVLITPSQRLLDDVAREINRIVESQPRHAIIDEALRTRGALLCTSDIDEAVRFAEAYAPEHLLLLTAEPRALLPRIRAAGTIFLGAPSSVAFGDYMTGANHVLPTGGLARAWSGLSTSDFMRWTTWQELTPTAASNMSAATSTLALAEGLPAHALAAQLRAGSRQSDTREPMAFRASYCTLTTYDPGRVPCRVDLSDNTNLFGAPPSAVNALNSIESRGITRYPDVYAQSLKRALAAINNVGPENITTGCGSDDVIDSAFRAFCDEDASIACTTPTFGMIPSFASMNSARLIEVPLGQDFDLNVGPLIDASAAVTYLCRPNNPTGTQFGRTAVERIAGQCRGVLLIDEAYADFADDNMAAFAAHSDRTVVLRTLSKAWGLAGLRIGYAIGPAALIAEIEKSRGPYKVSAAAEQTALAVLSRDGGWVRERIADVRANRARLRTTLERQGVRVLDSAANFLLIACDGPASAWNHALRAQGVGVRPFPDMAGRGDFLRVTIGPWEMMQQFLDAFDQVRTSNRELTA